MKRVIVLDGLLNPAVACVRSLARAGYRVIVGSGAPWSKSGLSRFCSFEFTYPDPQLRIRDFVESLVKLLRAEGPSVIMPSSEACVLAISANRQEIAAAGGMLILPPHEALLFACNKLKTTRRAAELGIPTPVSRILRTSQDADEMAKSSTGSCVLKPSCSEELRGDRCPPTSRPLYSRNPQEFMTAYAALRQVCSEVLVQEFVSGAGVLFSVLLHHGEFRAEFEYRRIRPVHPTGWGAALREGVQPDPRLREATLCMLRSIDPEWHGVGQLEFRIRADGTPVFLEVNPRFWHSLPLAVVAGVDFPLMMTRMASGEDIPVHGGYPAGVRCRWLLGDFRNLLYTWQGQPDGYPERIPGRLKALLSFLLPTPGAYHDNFEFFDPLPELGDWISAATRGWARQAHANETGPAVTETQPDVEPQPEIASTERGQRAS